MKQNVVGLLVAAFGFGLAWREHGALTTHVLIFAGACVAAGLWLVDAPDMKAFLASIASFVPWRREP